MFLHMFAMFFIVKVILYSFMLTVLDLILSNDRKRDGSYEHLICQIGKYHFISISKYLIHIYRMYIYITSSYKENNIAKYTMSAKVSLSGVFIYTLDCE